MTNPSKNVIKGFSLPEELFEKISAQAKHQKRSFSAFVRIAIERELDAPECKKEAHPEVQDEIIPITQVATMLRLSVSRVRVRSRKKGDPIRAARCLLAKQKPMHFHRSKIDELRCAKISQR